MGILRWKLDRELQRIGQQLRSIPEFFIEPGQRRRHDATRTQWLRPMQGEAPLARKVALLLLYQPAGVSKATRWTCEHLVRKGYAPLIISNAPLSTADRAMLVPVTWRMAERPNFGYDFGGYRDGIWLLDQLQADPDVLIILNDSIWFPLTSNENLIDRMEASTADFVGALQLDPLRQRDGIPMKKRPFFGSFFLMAKRGARQHLAFQRFWERYRLTSNKYKTIRRGERGLSHTLMDAGIRCEAIYTRSALDAHMQSLSNDALRELLQADLITIDERIEQEIRACVAAQEDSPDWRTRAINLALRTTEKQNVLATAPITSLKDFEVPYLKKSRDWNNLKALSLIRDRIRAGDLPAAHESVMQDLDQTLQR
jgi:hypothetical protein